MSDRKNAMLTERDREFLTSEGGIYTGEHARQQRYSRRKEIRERVVASLSDFYILLEYLDEQDREKILDDIGMRVPEHSLMGGPAQAQGGVVSAIAFLYELHEDTEHFEQTIERALARALTKEPGSTARVVEVDIDIKRVEDVDPAAVMEKVSEGRLDELSAAEHQFIVRVLAGSGNLAIEDISDPGAQVTALDDLWAGTRDDRDE